MKRNTPCHIDIDHKSKPKDNLGLQPRFIPKVDLRSYMDKLPPYSLDLIKLLDSLYPMSIPKVGTTEQELWFRYGQRHVVEHLMSLAQQQLDNVLE